MSARPRPVDGRTALSLAAGANAAMVICALFDLGPPDVSVPSKEHEVALQYAGHRETRQFLQRLVPKSHQFMPMAAVKAAPSGSWWLGGRST